MRDERGERRALARPAGQTVDVGEQVGDLAGHAEPVACILRGYGSAGGLPVGVEGSVDRFGQCRGERGPIVGLGDQGADLGGDEVAGAA